MHKLIIEDDEGKAVVVPLIRDEISVGRQEGNTIRLTERNVSRKHARLVRRDRLEGHILFDRAVVHPVVVDIKPNAYESGLFLHRFAIRSADQLDDAFASFVREAAARVGRRERLTRADR